MCYVNIGWTQVYNYTLCKVYVWVCVNMYVLLVKEDIFGCGDYAHSFNQTHTDLSINCNIWSISVQKSYIVDYLGWQCTVALIQIKIVDISNSLFVAARYPVEALVPDSAPRCQCRGP